MSVFTGCTLQSGKNGNAVTGTPPVPTLSGDNGNGETSALPTTATTPIPDKAPVAVDTLVPGDTVAFGSYYGQAITWLTLAVEGDMALLISKGTIDSKIYYRKGDSNMIYATWESCAIRAFLNGEFIDAAFSPKERDYIAETTFPNKTYDKNTTSAVKEPDATDRVFLLSYDEAKHYFSSDSDRVAVQAYSQEQMEMKSRNLVDEVDKLIEDTPEIAELLQLESLDYEEELAALVDTNGMPVQWWLRTTEKGSEKWGTSVATITAEGQIDARENTPHLLTASFTAGVRPVIWISGQKNAKAQMPPDDIPEQTSEEHKENNTVFTINGAYTVTIPEELQTKQNDGTVTIDTGTWRMDIKTSNESTIESAMAFWAGYEWKPFTYGAATGRRILEVLSDTQGKFEFFFSALGEGGAAVGQIEFVKYDGAGSIETLLEDPLVKSIFDSIRAPE
ncbi:MAG: DUF6273 domain-containing protein [Oscillospiraceae bacterium]|nr:DUF6273 domain-containing protein [Oscillospiraceae bacterium]